MPVTSAAFGTVPASRRDAGVVALLESLSEDILRRRDLGLWRQVFLGPTHDSIRFSFAELTLLVADAPSSAAASRAAAVLAAEADGAPELLACGSLALSFPRPAAALHTAQALQRLAEPELLRTVLRTAVCSVALFDLDGAPRRVVFGSALRAAESGIRLLAPGTIGICPETCARLGEGLTDLVQDALVIVETDEDGVTHASVVRPPSPSSRMSTFAGLGLG